MLRHGGQLIYVAESRNHAPFGKDPFLHSTWRAPYGPKSWVLPGAPDSQHHWQLLGHPERAGNLIDAPEAWWAPYGPKLGKRFEIQKICLDFCSMNLDHMIVAQLPEVAKCRDDLRFPLNQGSLLREINDRPWTCLESSTWAQAVVRWLVLNNFWRAPLGPEPLNLPYGSLNLIPSMGKSVLCLLPDVFGELLNRAQVKPLKLRSEPNSSAVIHLRRKYQENRSLKGLFSAALSPTPSVGSGKVLVQQNKFFCVLQMSGELHMGPDISCHFTHPLLKERPFPGKE